MRSKLPGTEVSRRTARRKAASLCPGCGQCPPKAGAGKCQKCLDWQRNYQRDYKLRLIEAGKCVNCMDAARPGETQCDSCADSRNIKWSAKYHSRPEWRSELSFSRIKAKYGIDRDEWIAMAENQGWCCAICGRDNRRLVVDHCHTTGTVRGLLCGQCNSIIGKLGDNTQGLMRAVRYLADHKRTTYSNDYLSN